MTLKEMRKGLRDMALDQARHWSGQAVAEYMGVSYPTYHKWEEDPSLLTRGQAERLADYFGCTAEQVFSLPTESN